MKAKQIGSKQEKSTDKFEPDYKAADVGEKKSLKGDDYTSIVMSFNDVCKSQRFPILKELIEDDVFVVEGHACLPNLYQFSIS